MAVYEALKPVFSACLCLLVLALWVPNAMAYEKGDIVVRAGVAVIDARGDIGSVTLSGTDLGEFGVERVTLPVVNASYFFSEHFAVEVLLGKPPTFEIYGTSGLIEDIPIGQVQAFPLVVVADYYPMNPQSRWQPHVGVGLNYVISGESSVDPELVSRFGADSAEISQIENSLGLVLSLGLDYMLTERLILAADAYYLDVKAEAQIEVLINDQIYAAQLSGRSGRAPIIYSLTLGYRF
jgi:outer membrane protein